MAPRNDKFFPWCHKLRKRRDWEKYNSRRAETRHTVPLKEGRPRVSPAEIAARDASYRDQTKGRAEEKTREAKKKAGEQCSRAFEIGLSKAHRLKPVPLKTRIRR